MAQKGEGQEKGGDCLLVVAIDFGTTYSGYAFQFKHEYSRQDPTNINTVQPWNFDKKQLFSTKTPTCLLLDENGEIDSFGYEAEDKYADLCIEHKHKKWYYFRRFKMKLHDMKSLTKQTEIEDETQKKMSALKVFSKSIECLKNHLLDMLDKKNAEVQPKEIMWVLTVPAIWDDCAKVFMREAAVEAGISNDRLEIALEPEAASLFCQYLPVEKFCVGGKAGFSDASIGTTYMVVDLGGGTADITVHEKIVGGKLKEVFRASGGPWGGTAVDGEFLRLLGDIVGGPLVAEFMREEKYDYLDLMREFETVKRTISTTSDSEIKIKMPVPLNNLCKRTFNMDLKERVTRTMYKGDIQFVADKMKIKPNVIRGLFKKVTDKILRHIHNILNKEAAGKRVKLILMVGGFSESPYVQEVMKKAFHEQNGRSVLIPRDAGIAVLNGAVIFGRHPDSITSRILRYTYGVRTAPKFDPAYHESNKKYVDSEGVERCSDFFCKFIEVGTEAEIGHTVNDTYCSVIPFQKEVALNIYITEDPSPQYVDDDGCKQLGYMEVQIPNPSEEQHALEVSFKFGLTELRVNAVEVDSGKECDATISLVE